MSLKAANSQVVADWHSRDYFDTLHALCCIRCSAVKMWIKCAHGQVLIMKGHLDRVHVCSWVTGTTQLLCWNISLRNSQSVFTCLSMQVGVGWLGILKSVSMLDKIRFAPLVSHSAAMQTYVYPSQQSWYKPKWLTLLKTPTNKNPSQSAFAASVQSVKHRVLFDNDSDSMC